MCTNPPHLIEDSVSHAVVKSLRTELKMAAQRPLRGKLGHHAEGVKCHAHQSENTGVAEHAHDGELLTEVLVLLHQAVSLVGVLKYLHCH